MMLYSQKNVRKLSFIIAILLWCVILAIIYCFVQSQEKTLEPTTSITLKAEEKNNEEQNLTDIELILKASTGKSSPSITYSSCSWRIEIPKIQLNAPIYEGTEAEILRKGIGHFENTATWEGNVCLIAENKEDKYNYFQNIDLLQIGDEIIYQTEKGTKTYVVQVNEKVKETNLKYIQNTKENRITLITYEEDEKEYRRYVQAVQKEM